MLNDTGAGLFAPDADNRVPGELILKVEGVAGSAAAAAIPVGPARLLSVALPTTLGIPAVDAVLSALGVEGLTLVHGAPAAPAGTATAESLAGELAGTVVARLPASTDLSAAAAQLLAADAVQSAEPNRFREALATQPNDPMFGLEWGLTTIRAPEAWDIQRGDPSIIVAVVDTGVDLDHPDLAGNLVAGRDLVDLVNASPSVGFHFEGDVTTPDDIPEDEVGHGTHVAGTIAAVTDNSVGVAGVSWSCKVMPVRVLARVVRDADGFVSGTGTAVDIAAGIRWAVDHDASVINMSLGGYGDTTVERDAVAYAVANGVVIVAAMGNDNTTSPMFPAAYPGVIAVGAVGQDQKRANFSNKGAHIGVVAPGVGIRSTFLSGGFADLSGTSMATPHVSGLAALIKSATPTLTAAQVGDRVRATARPLQDSAGDPVPNPSYGAGLIDAFAALNGAGPQPPTPPTPPAWPGRNLRYPPITQGPDVAQWQQRMVERGFTLVVDGKYGPKSRQACVEFQQSKGLSADGIVGPITWGATFADD